MRAFTASTTALAALLSSTVAAKWDANSNSNVAVYWGQGGNQNSLTSVCENPSIDTVILSFITKFPTKVGGYPSSDFGNACWAETFVHNNEPTGLYKTCKGIAPGIAECHKRGKKVFLSLGGETSKEPINDPAVAKYFAEFLWGAFGPSTENPPASWVEAGSPRPFVFENGETVSIDGIDFDIEIGGPAGYDVMINHFKDNLIGKKEFYFSAAPQCLTDDKNLGEVIKKAPLDMLFVQFYNTPSCSALTGYNELKSGRGDSFTFDAWVDWVHEHSKNPDVKIYLGLHASSRGDEDKSYINPIQAQELAKSLKGRHSNQFGGVMLWQASTNDLFDTASCGRDYAYYVKKAIAKGSIDSVMTCPTTSSTIVSSTSSSQTPTTTSHTTTTAESSTLVSTTSTSQVTSSTSSQPTSTSLSSSAETTQASSTEASSTQASSTEASSTQASSTEASSTEASSTQASSTEASSTQASSTEASSTEASSTEASSTQASSTAESTPQTTEASSTASPSDTMTSFPTITPTGPWSNVTSSSQVAPTTTVIITSYVDICPTGLVTVPVTITSTICTACPQQTATVPAIPTGWTTTVTVCTVCGATPTTVTLTKPIVEATPTSTTIGVPPVIVAEEPVEKTTLTHITRVLTKVLTATQSTVEPVATPSETSFVVTLVPVPTKSSNGTGYAHPTGGSPTYTSQPPAFTGAASKTTVSLGMFAGLIVALMAL